MVSMRHASAPSPPVETGVVVARALPDDPPPTPPSFPLPHYTLIRSSPNGLLTRQDPHLTTNGTVVVGANVQKNGAYMPHPMENGGTEYANGHTGIVNELGQPRLRVPHAQQDDDADSEAPEVESSTAAAAAARAQLTRERNVRNAAKESRRARRHAAGERARRTLDERESLEMQVEEDGEAMDVEREKEEERKNNAVELPLLLPENVLRAAENAVGESRRAEKERRSKERLKRQKGKVGKALSTKQVGGVEVEILSKLKKRVPSRDKGNRSTAATFLQHCMNKAGVRVSAAAAARIASSAKIRNV